MTDKQLYILCKKYGAECLRWRRRFEGLLPEVNRRRLFEKKGFGSIFEFSARLAGLSKEQVKRVLNLDRLFENRPVLRRLLANGEVSASRLSRITAVATSENESYWAEQTRNLSFKALNTLVRDVKIAEVKNVACAIGANEGLFLGVTQKNIENVHSEITKNENQNGFPMSKTKQNQCAHTGRTW